MQQAFTGGAAPRRSHQSMSQLPRAHCCSPASAWRSGPAACHGRRPPPGL